MTYELQDPYVHVPYILCDTLILSLSWVRWWLNVGCLGTWEGVDSASAYVGILVRWFHCVSSAGVAYQVPLIGNPL